MRTHARYELQDSASSSLDEVLPSSSLDSPLSVGSGGLITASSRSVSSESTEPLPTQLHHTSGVATGELSNSQMNKVRSGVDEGEEIGLKPPSPMDTNEETGAREKDDDDSLL